MSMNINELSDESFMEFANCLAPIEDLQEKLGFYLRVNGRTNFKPYESISRKIGNETIAVHIPIYGLEAKQTYFEWYLDNFRKPTVEALEGDLDDSIAKCSDQDEIKDLVNLKLSEIEGIIENNDYVGIGYMHHVSKTMPIIDSSFNEKRIEDCAYGFIMYDFLKVIRGRITSSAEPIHMPDDLNGPSISKKQHKFVLLVELGIIDHLDARVNFKQMKQADQIKLLALVLGLDSPEDRSTLKRCLTSYQLQNNDILTDNALNQVRNALSAVGVVRL